jgi:hypothetical protein
MKLFISLLAVAVIAVGVWALWPNGSDEVTVLSTATTSPSASSVDDLAFLQTPTPTPVPTRSATPRVTPTPVPGQGGQGPAPVRVPVFITMNSMNGSGQYGTATITANDDDLATVWFNLNAGPGNVRQHASIVNGTCSSIGSTVFALQPLLNGSSMTTLNANFLDVTQSQSKLAIVVFSPEDRFQFPYACGQLR